MKTFLVTGVGRGIGLALTKEFVKKGHAVIGTYRDEASAKDLLDFARRSKAVTTVVADVSNPKSLFALQAELEKAGQIDGLVNNSGVIGGRADSFMTFDIEKALDVFQVNTFGPMRVTKLALPFLRKGGVIAQITSLMGSIEDNSSGGYYDYRMSKAALNMFHMSLTRDFPEFVCLTLHPGWVQTNMGGPGATLATEDCARGLVKIILESGLEKTGSFLDYSGKKLPW